MGANWVLGTASLLRACEAPGISNLYEARGAHDYEAMMRQPNLTGEELADLLIVTPSTIRSWVRRGCPVFRRGERGNKNRPSLYREAAVRGWLEKRESERRDVDQARARRERAHAILAEQTVAIRAHDLFRRDQIEKAWAAECVRIRTRLRRIPGELSGELMHVIKKHPDERVSVVERTVNEHVYRVLEELARPEKK